MHAMTAYHTSSESTLMDRFLLVCLTFAVASAVPVSKSGYQRTVSYEGEILVRCPIKVPSVKSFLDNDHIDIWKISPEGEADIRVTQSVLESSGVGSECIKLGDIETIVQKAENLTFTGVDWFAEYHRYDEMVQWYKNLTNANGEIVTYVDSIGKSIEGRDQPAIHIRTETSKNIIYLQCQIHAREWISGATCMYIAYYLVDRYGNYYDHRVTNLLKEVEFVIVPFVNPDGYEYTWTNDRLWRKNRRHVPGGSCDGVDLDRNYNYHWGDGGSSSDPCTDTYRGTSAESEPETQNTAKYFRSLKNVIGAIDFHSYTQYILRPYAWTTANTSDEAQLNKLGDDVAMNIFFVNGIYYTSLKSSDVYKASGTASDWFYSDDANVNNQYRAAGYAIELRDTGLNKFQLPPDQIRPQGEEIVNGVLEFAEQLNKSPLKKFK